MKDDQHDEMIGSIPLMFAFQSLGLQIERFGVIDDHK
jgi:hypothetical protein